MGNCGDRSPKCIIYSGPSKMEDHYYGVTGCTKRKEKICVHIITKCAYYGSHYCTNSSHHVSKDRADVKAPQQKKTIKNGQKKV